MCTPGCTAQRCPKISQLCLGRTYPPGQLLEGVCAEVTATALPEKLTPKEETQQMPVWSPAFTQPL